MTIGIVAEMGILNGLRRRIEERQREVTEMHQAGREPYDKSDRKTWRGLSASEKADEIAHEASRRKKEGARRLELIQKLAEMGITTHTKYHSESDYLDIGRAVVVHASQSSIDSSTYGGGFLPKDRTYSSSYTIRTGSHAEPYTAATQDLSLKALQAIYDVVTRKTISMPLKSGRKMVIGKISSIKLQEGRTFEIYLVDGGADYAESTEARLALGIGAPAYQVAIPAIAGDPIELEKLEGKSGWLAGAGIDKSGFNFTLSRKGKLLARPTLGIRRDERIAVAPGGNPLRLTIVPGCDWRFSISGLSVPNDTADLLFGIRA